MKKGNQNKNINLFIEIDPEKRVFYISDYTTDDNMKGRVRRFKSKKDIIRIFSNYLFKNVYIYSSKKGRKNKYE